MNTTDKTVYRLIRSARKTVSLEIRPDGEVLVRAPNRMAVREIELFVAKHRAWIVEKQALQTMRAEQHNALTEADIKRLKDLARQVLPSKIQYFSNLMGVNPTGFHVTNAQKRFGSCNGKNSLCFSWMLMQYPEEAIDYVVVHELAHIKHHNHSAAFYRFAAQYLPDYKEREKILRNPLQKADDGCKNLKKDEEIPI